MSDITMTIIGFMTFVLLPICFIACAIFNHIWPMYIWISCFFISLVPIYYCLKEGYRFLKGEGE